MFESRKRVFKAVMRNLDRGTQIELEPCFDWNAEAAAATLMLLVMAMTEDYLHDEAKALHELIVNDLADKEWEKAHPENGSIPFDELPF